MNDELTELAIAAYQAYGDSANQKNYQGNPMPSWDELPTAIQNHWRAATNQVRVDVLTAIAREMTERRKKND